MKRKNLATIVLLGVASLLSSCAKEGPAGPTGPSGLTYVGCIAGHVNLYDMYGSKVLTGYDSVRLFLNGNTAYEVPDSANGYYIYGSLATGVYNLAATCPGYGATRLNNIQFLADTLNKDIKLSAIPDSFVTGFTTYSSTVTKVDSLVLSFKADTRVRYAIIFANSSPAVSNQVSNYLWYKVISISPTAPIVAFTVPEQDLTNTGLTVGANVYYAAYSYVVSDGSVYEDLATGKNVYNAVNANPIIDTAVVP